MKVVMEMDVKQARLIQKALELYVRVGTGQLDILLEHPTIQESIFNNDNRKEVGDSVVAFKDVAFPNLPRFGSLGIHNKDLQEEVRNAYDIYQTARYELRPRGFNTTLLHVDNNEPIKYGTFPLPDVTLLETENK